MKNQKCENISTSNTKASNAVKIAKNQEMRAVQREHYDLKKPFIKSKL